MKRILLVAVSHGGGGAQKAFLQESLLLNQNGHDVAHLVASDDPFSSHCDQSTDFPYSKPIIENIPGLYRPVSVVLKGLYNRSWWRGHKIRQDFEHAIKTFKPDIIHIHDWHDYLYYPDLLEMPMKFNIPLHMTIHGTGVMVCPTGLLLKGGLNVAVNCDGICSRETDTGASSREFKCFSSPLREKVMLEEFKSSFNSIPKCADLITAPSQFLVNLIARTQRVSPDRLSLLYNTCHPDLLKIEPQTSSPPKKTFYLALGRLVPRKGFLSLLEAFKQMPDIPLILVGEGEQRPELERFIQNNQMQNVKLLSWTSGDELWKLLNDCYGVILPSIYHENAPVVIQEAFANGKHMIATEMGGNPEFVIHEECGRIYTSGDVSALQHHVKELWDNPDLALQYGKNAYKRFYDNFNYDYNYAQLINSFEQAARNHYQKQTPSKPYAIDHENITCHA